MTVFSEQNGPSLTLTHREPENSLCYKRLIWSRLPGPHFSHATFTPSTSVRVNESHLWAVHLTIWKIIRQIYGGKQRRGLFVFLSSLFNDPFHTQRLKAKGRRRHGKDERGEPYWSPPRSHRQLPSCDDEVATQRVPTRSAEQEGRKQRGHIQHAGAGLPYPLTCGTGWKNVLLMTVDG